MFPDIEPVRLFLRTSIKVEKTANGVNEDGRSLSIPRVRFNRTNDFLPFDKC